MQLRANVNPAFVGSPRGRRGSQPDLAPVVSEAVGEILGEDDAELFEDVVGGGVDKRRASLETGFADEAVAVSQASEDQLHQLVVDVDHERFAAAWFKVFECSEASQKSKVSCCEGFLIFDLTLFRFI